MSNIETNNLSEGETARVMRYKWSIRKSMSTVLRLEREGRKTFNLEFPFPAGSVVYTGIRLGPLITNAVCLWSAVTGKMWITYSLHFFL